MTAVSLTTHIDNCLAHAQFTDFYNRRFNVSSLRQRYEANHPCPLTSTEAIDVRQEDLDALASELDARLGTFKSPASGAIGNGLYLVMGTSGSPRLPSVEDYAKILVLAAARIGPDRTAGLLTDWIQGSPIPSRSCAAVTGVKVNGLLNPVVGLRLETLPPTPELSLSTRHRFDGYGRPLYEVHERTILTVEYETTPGLYDPETYRESFPPVIPRTPVNQNLKALPLPRLCEALSLTVDNYVDWYEQWNDHADAEAFSLQPRHSRLARDVRSRSTVLVTAEQLSACLDTDAQVRRKSADLALPVARWLRSKGSPAEHEQLIELRIALEAVFLKGDERDGEKRHRLAVRGAWFLGETLKDRRAYFDALRVVYDYASHVIHGGRPKPKPGRDMAQDIALVQDLCRRAILRMARPEHAVDWNEMILGGDDLLTR